MASSSSSSSSLPNTSAPPAGVPVMATVTRSVAQDLALVTIPLTSSQRTAGSSCVTTEQVLVIDASSSMEGTPFQQVRAGLKSILRHHEASSEAQRDASPPPTTIVYNDRATICSLSQAIHADPNGCTCFVSTFRALRTLVSKSRGSRVVVAYMTDGEDTVNSSSAIQSELNNLQFYLRNCGKEVIVHGLGYGSNHKFAFLERLRKLGTVEGVYRYAEGNSGLEDVLLQLFELAESTREQVVLINGKEHKAVVEAGEDHVDVWLTADDAKAPVTSVQLKDDALWTVDGQQVKILPESAARNPLFVLKKLARASIATASELDAAQSELGQVKLFGCGLSSEQRALATELRSSVQDKLNALHAVLADIARGAVQGTSALAKLNDLRYATHFSKAGRQRRMDQRVAKNQGRLQQVDQRLAELAAKHGQGDSALSCEPRLALDSDAAAEFTCTLSLSTAGDLMRDSTDDVLGFGLTVVRAEHTVDAPSTLSVQDVSLTFVSRVACEDAIQLALLRGGAQAAASVHGGFVPSVKPKTLTNEEQLLGAVSMQRSASASVYAAAAAGQGIAKGVANESFNAWLPLYVCEPHFARVECLIEPICGWLYTLDPCGYKRDQIVALYAIMGQLLQRSRGSEREELIISEFGRVCAALLPRARAALDGKDLVDEFVASPAGRTKAAVQNLMTLVGWTYARKIEAGDLCMTNPWGKQLRLPLTEEWIRRQMDHAFHGVPPLVVQKHLHELLYGHPERLEAKGGAAEEKQEHELSSATSDAAVNSSSSQTTAAGGNPKPKPKPKRNSQKAADKQYAAWFRHKVTQRGQAEREPRIDFATDLDVPTAESLQHASTPPIVPARQVRNKLQQLLGGVSVTGIDRALKRIDAPLFLAEGLFVGGTKCTTTALAVVPPDAVCEALDVMRSKHDKAFGRWMPHCNLFFPFVSADQLDHARIVLGRVIAAEQLGEFAITLSDFAFFAQADHTFTVHAVPDPASTAILQRLHRVCAEAICGVNDDQEASHHHQPHFTVGQWICPGGVDELENTILVHLRRAWQPVTFVVKNLQLLSRVASPAPSSVFTCTASIPLITQSITQAIATAINSAVGAAVAAAVAPLQQQIHALQDASTSAHQACEMPSQAQDVVGGGSITEEVENDQGELSLMRAMMVQALRFCTNDAVNQAVEQKKYHGALSQEHHRLVLEALHAEFEVDRQQNARTKAEELRSAAIARLIVAATDIWAFAGRLAQATETRGGRIFDHVCALLQDTTRSHPWPHLEEKITLLFTGMLEDHHGAEKQQWPVFAHGSGWRADELVKRRFREAMGEEAYSRLRLRMCSAAVIGHVYRSSDIRNRHGYHNSHPYAGHSTLSYVF